jgi:hypothetical protein
MKKLLFAISFLTLATTSAIAQDMTTGSTSSSSTKMGAATFSIAGNIGTGTKKGYTTSYGGDIEGEFGLGNSFRATASAGYQNFHTSNYTINNVVYDDISYIPVLAGTKIALGKGLYVHPQLGYSFLTRKISGSNQNNGEFTYAASLGHGFGKNFDVAVKYLSVDVVNAVLLRLAYNF